MPNSTMLPGLLRYSMNHEIIHAHRAAGHTALRCITIMHTSWAGGQKCMNGVKTASRYGNMGRARACGRVQVRRMKLFTLKDHVAQHVIISSYDYGTIFLT